MARTRSSSSGLRYCNPSYYLKRPKRLALLFISFVCVSFVVWDRQTLVREHEVEIEKLNEEVTHLQEVLEDLRNGKGSAVRRSQKDVPDDPLDIERRGKKTIENSICSG